MIPAMAAVPLQDRCNRRIVPAGWTEFVYAKEMA